MTDRTSFSSNKGDRSSTAALFVVNSAVLLLCLSFFVFVSHIANLVWIKSVVAFVWIKISFDFAAVMKALHSHVRVTK